jgi:hypothetical protein
MAQDIRLMWPSIYDPITDTHVMTVGKGANRKMYMFTSEEWENYAYVNGSFKEKEVARHPKYTAEAARLKPTTKPKSGYDLGWADPRGLSYLSSDADRKAVDKKISDEYDSIFGHDEDMAKAFATKLAASMAATKDAAAASAVWSTRSTPTTWAETWDEFAATKGELPMNPFLDKVVKMEYVGSRVTCTPAPTDTDEDVLLLTDDLNTLIGDCIEVGFDRDGDHKASYPTEFVSLRSGTINFIVTDNEEFFEKFMLATHVCKSLNVLNKSDRITVFQAILYGKEYLEVTSSF